MSLTPPAPGSIRPATEADLEALATLEDAAFPGESWSRGQIAASLARSIGLALLAECVGPQTQAEGSCLGWVIAGEAELERILTAPWARRRGVGAALLTRFLQACAEGGAERVFLEVRADNAAAIALYGRHGFVERGRRPRYYRDGTDALVMEHAVLS